MYLKLVREKKYDFSSIVRKHNKINYWFTQFYQIFLASREMLLQAAQLTKIFPLIYNHCIF